MLDFGYTIQELYIVCFLCLMAYQPVAKIGMKIATNISVFAPCARFIFLTGKKVAALSKLISQMVTYLHVGSQVKPRRVKMHMQMRAGRKEHKNNECRHSVYFCFYVGQELVRREATVSLKKQRRRELSNKERRFWLVIAGFCS